MDLYALHVMPLLPGHEAEMARDAEMLLEKKICSHIACSMTLVPERTPAADKAAVYRQRYRDFMTHFRGDPSKVGILLQATIGHGWTPDEPVDFQKIVHAQGFEQYRMCPLDSRFLDYLDDQVGKLSALQPAFFMVDDDFRLETGNTGCMCPLHLRAFADKYGIDCTREELLEAMKHNSAIAENFADLCLDSFTAAARVIRRAIDRNAPGVPCSYCTCVGDMRGAPVIAGALAADGQRSIIRINNARYNCADMRTFPARMYAGASQIAALDRDTLVLAETDTCPQIRYSTAAGLMHSHYTGSIIEGCRGAKHWITKMNNFMPEAGCRYRDILAENSSFYQVLADALDGSCPEYFAAALPGGKVKPHNIAENSTFNCCSGENWASFAANMGLPAHFTSPSAGLPAMITGDDVEFLNREDLTAAAAAGLIIDGSAAIKITEKGFSDIIGIKALPHTGSRVSGERWKENIISSANNYADLEICGGRYESVSQLIHRTFALDTELDDIGPALLFGENPQGGRCAVFAGAVTSGIAFQRFSWMDLCRKDELIEAMKFVSGGDIAYIEGDDEVYFKSFSLADGKHLLTVFALSFDPLEAVRVHLPYSVSLAEELMADGSWQKTEYKDGVLCAAVGAGSPGIFRISE